MKKVLFAVLAVVMLAGSVFAIEGGALNLKAGVDLAGNISYGKDGSGDDDIKAGFSIAGEYLFKFNDMFRLGAGIEYLIPREADANSDVTVNYMPIYVSAELSPISSVRELYFKGNLGYNVIADIDYDLFKDMQGGVYWGIGAGYVFDFGLFFDVMYSWYYSTFEVEGFYYDLDVSATYSKLGLNVGYRFNF